MSEYSSVEAFEEGVNPELLELAESSPRTGQIYPGSPSQHSQFRHNFYMRFSEIKAVRMGEATDSQVFYVRMVKERFGFDLLFFYEEQKQLCEAICEALEEKEPYDRLVSACKEFEGSEGTGTIHPASVDQLNLAVGHPLGIEAIGIYYWDKINPLLAQAYELVEARTLNAPFLTK